VIIKPWISNNMVRGKRKAKDFKKLLKAKKSQKPQIYKDSNWKNSIEFTIPVNLNFPKNFKAFDFFI
jgi:hypothetical protein